jgi:hypothetical protein
MIDFCCAVVRFPVPALACGLLQQCPGCVVSRVKFGHRHEVPVQAVPRDVPLVCRGRRMETGMPCQGTCSFGSWLATVDAILGFRCASVN